MLACLFRDALGRILRLCGTQPATLVAALSGGMDSVVAAHLLSQCADSLPDGCRIIAAHLNHRLRTEADEDETFCREYAQHLNIPFASRQTDVAALARTEQLGLEEAGRLARYRYFHELGGAHALVITGHHADDQAETILMNLRRGAHRRGLSGMRELSAIPVPPGATVRIARPLLAVDRAALHHYALAHRLAWRTDATNADDAFTRNRIRNKIIPMLESILPGFKQRLLERAEATARQEDVLSRAGADFAAGQTRREANGRFFRIDGAALDAPERLLYAFRHVVEEEMGARLPYGAVLTRLSELAAGGRLGETLSLPGRLRVRRERDGLFFFFPGVGGGDGYTEVVLPDPPFRIVAYGLEITAEWGETAGVPPREDMVDPDVEWLHPAAIRWPLRLRPPFEGERFRALGAPGSRKIQDMIVDAKLPRRKRSLPRVLADYAGAIWLWPLRLAERVRLPGTPGRALRMRIRERLPE